MLKNILASPLRRGAAAVLLVLGVLVGLYLVRGRVLPAAATWLDVGQPPRPADYVLVLGGGANRRPFVAAALVKAGLARKVLLSRTYATPANQDGILPIDHEVSRRILLARGVRAEDIVELGEDHRTTCDEARALARLLESEPRARVTVVTHGFHTRRARWILGQALGERIAQVSMLSTPPEAFQADNWWQCEIGFKYILGENLKFAFYLLHYD